MNMNATTLTTLNNVNIDDSLNSTQLLDYNFDPNFFECCLLILAFTIFVVGIIGNLLVIIVVVKNAHMRTITNIFIVNLAIGDFLVILICLPPSVITDVTGNWWFGNAMCKIIPFVQYISVCVSVMTLTSISYERYYAIVYPLKFQATKFRAKIILLVIWVVSILINLPHPIVIKLEHENNTMYCKPQWPPTYQIIFDVLLFIILYILPMALIFYTYTRVVKVLWKIDKSIAWDESPSGGDQAQSRQGSAASPTKNTTTTYLFSKKGVPITNSSEMITSASGSNNNGAVVKPLFSYTMASGSSTAKSKMKNQLIARRKAAKMLISVAFLFAICYFPIYILNISRYIPGFPFMKNVEPYLVVLFQISHCLVYVNSCVNPLIYNFMSDNFRKEFRKIIFCNMVKPSPNNSELGTNELKIRYLNGTNNNNNNARATNFTDISGSKLSHNGKNVQKSSSSNYRLYQ